jgi:cytochrome c5
MKKIFFLLLCFCSFSCLSEHSFHHPAAFIKNLKGDKKPGKKIYGSFCANCHNIKPLINLGAPRIGVKTDWTSRLKQSLPEMMKKVSEGVGNMPPRGGCFECSDKMLEDAVKYMLPKDE